MEKVSRTRFFTILLSNETQEWNESIPFFAQSKDINTGERFANFANLLGGWPINTEHFYGTPN